MNISDPIRLLAGSTAVYLSVATLHACGSSSPPMGPLASGGDGGSGSGNGASMTGAGGGAGMSAGQTSGAADGSTGSIMDPVGDAHANESGSRLKAKWYVGADGAKQWIGWYDSQRQEDCYFGSASDGSVRCIPQVYSGIMNAYNDAACKTHVTLLGSACSQAVPIPKYVAEYVLSTCDSPAHYRIYNVVGKFPGTNYFAIDSKNACVATTLPAGYTMALVGAEIQPTEFVEASTVTE